VQLAKDGRFDLSETKVPEYETDVGHDFYVSATLLPLLYATLHPKTSAPTWPSKGFVRYLVFRASSTIFAPNVTMHLDENWIGR